MGSSPLSPVCFFSKPFLYPSNKTILADILKGTVVILLATKFLKQQIQEIGISSEASFWEKNKGESIQKKNLTLKKNL